MTQPQLIGILNITDNSFSHDGTIETGTDPLEKAHQLIASGAALLDVGAEATNPWASPLTNVEEWARLEPVLGNLIEAYPGRISLDTHHPETAEKALRLGLVILNDVTTFRDPAMVALAVEYQTRCIVSHMPFAAPSIQVAHEGPNVDSVYTVRDDLLTRAEEMIAQGVLKKNIILDPGIGFGKTMETNYNLLKFAELVPDFSVLIGHSRKRFIADHWGVEKTDVRANVTAGRIAARAGAKYLRVHDPENYVSLTK